AETSTPRRAHARPAAWAATLPRNLVRFGMVGSAGLACDAALFLLMAAQGVPEPLARAFSLGAATLLTWRLNRRFTFGDSARREAFEGGCYGLVALGAQGFNYVTFLALRAILPAWPSLLALFA